MAPRNARFWLLTIPADGWDVPTELPNAIARIRGQRERGAGTGYEHWQLVAHFKQPTRLATVKRYFGARAHAEPTASAAAEAYVWKEDTAVPNTRFELGRQPIRRNNATDWARVRELAATGNLNDVDDDILVRYYHNLRSIASDHTKPIAMDRSVSVWWGPTNCGKSHAAWQAAGGDAYPKDPRTKFWDGYDGDNHVVIDEFRGGIDISHILRWFDKYPVRVEIKGSTKPLMATHFFVTSNIHPRDWYPDLDNDTIDALLRRMTITHCNIPYVRPESPDIVNE